MIQKKYTGEFNQVVIIVLFCFIFSRIVSTYYFNLNISNISYGYHLLDKDLLNSDLLQSLFYLHSQPYLWNLFNGVVLKIFSGSETDIRFFFTFYHYFLSILSILIFFKILQILKFSKKHSLIILIFLSINPTMIFYEKIFSYAHTSFFIFNCLVYSIFKFFHSNKKDFYEIGIYFSLFLIGNLWLLFQPLLLLPISYAVIRFFKKNNYKVFSYFLIFFILSIAPAVKNKIVFNEFVISSKSGHDIKDVFINWQSYCDHPVIHIKKYQKIYEKKNNIYFTHPSLIGEKSKFNNVGMISYSQNCRKITISRIIDEPKLYLKHRVRAFLASHGKFGFDYMHPVPEGWENAYAKINKLYEDKKIKLTRQILIFIFKMFVYFLIISFLFNKSEKKELKVSILIFCLTYLYLLLMATFVAGTEQERILYTGFSINVIFLIIFFKKIKLFENK